MTMDADTYACYKILEFHLYHINSNKEMSRFITVTLVNTKVGWSLKPCRCLGGYIHSVEIIESTEADSKEQRYDTNLIGCVIWCVGGVLVHEWTLDDIIKELRSTSRPCDVQLLAPWPQDYYLRPDTEKYLYYTRRITLREFLHDPRKHKWLQDFIISFPNPTKRAELGIMISALLVCYKAEHMESNQSILQTFQSNPYLATKYEREVGRRKQPESDTSQIQLFIQNEMSYLNYTLEKQVYEDFLNSIAYLRMCGHFYKCFEYEDLSISQIVQDETYFGFYYLYANVTFVRSGSTKLVHICHMYRLIEEYLEDGDDELLLRIIGLIDIMSTHEYFTEYFKAWNKVDLSKVDPAALTTLFENVKIDLMKVMQGEQIHRFKNSEYYDEILSLIASRVNLSIPNKYDRLISIPSHIAVHKISDEVEEPPSTSEDVLMWLTTFDVQGSLQSILASKEASSPKSIIQCVVPIESKEEPSNINIPMQNMPKSMQQILELYVLPEHEYFISAPNVLSYQQPRILTTICNLSPTSRMFGATLIFYRIIDASKLLSPKAKSSESQSKISFQDTMTNLGRKILLVGATLPQRFETLANSSSRESLEYEYETYHDTMTYMSLEDIKLKSTEELQQGVMYAAHGIAVVSYDEKDIPRIRHALSLTADKITNLTQSPGAQAVEIIDVLMSTLEENKIPPNGCSTVPKVSSTPIIQNYLGMKAIAVLVIAVALEYHVIISSTKFASAIPDICDWLIEAIKPLKYCHMIAPTIPANILSELISCPTPYIIGYYGDPMKILAELGIDISKRDDAVGEIDRVMIVTLEQNEILMPKNFESNHYQAILSLLGLLQESMLMPRDRRGSQCYNCDTASSASIFNRMKPYRDKDFLTTCQEYMEEILILRDVPTCCWPWPELNSPDRIRPYDKILFNEDLFLQLKHEDTDEVTTVALMRTQLFSNYISAVFK